MEAANLTRVIVIIVIVITVIHQVALARRPRRDLSVFESSCHLSNTQWRLHTVPLIAERQAGKL